MNPYEASNADLSDAVDGNELPLTRMFALNGRIGRMRFIAYLVLSASLLSFLFEVTMVVDGIFLGREAKSMGLTLAQYGSWITMGGFCSLYFIYARRRLQDTDDAWWWALLALVPFVNRVFWLYLIFRGGTEGENSYGIPPRKNSVWVILGALLVPLLSVIAALVLPAYMKYSNKIHSTQQKTAPLNSAPINFRP